MPRLRFVLLPFVLAAGASGADAQFLRERTDGLSRICTYAGSANVVTGAPTRSVRIGLSQNCPVTYPDSSSALQAPPSAQLRSDTVAGTERQCVYEQAGTTWAFVQSVSVPCPLYAGMVQLRPAARPGSGN